MKTFKNKHQNWERFHWEWIRRVCRLRWQKNHLSSAEVRRNIQEVFVRWCHR